jgi:HECT-like Ubiquitin-conjugating enzyme (E2)-binding
VQMPSSNWRDVAENWFGNCCCSFGAAAENLATQYLNSFNLSPEIGFLSSMSITVSKDSLHGYPHNPAHQEPSLDLLEINHANPKLPFLVSCNGSHDDAHGPDEVADISNKEHRIHTTSNCNVNNGPDRYNGRNIYFGGGFVHYEADISNDVEWVGFCCETCSSPLGSYPCQKDMGNAGAIDGGVRLFKCYISTSAPVGGPGDVFRLVMISNYFMFIALVPCPDFLFS